MVRNTLTFQKTKVCFRSSLIYHLAPKQKSESRPLLPFMQCAAPVDLGSKPPLAAFTHQKNWIEVPSVRFLQFPNLVCGRSEGPQSARGALLCQCSI
jgi:hypothetical protein